MAIDFPDAPALYEEFVAGNTIYVWNGRGWLLKSLEAHTVGDAPPANPLQGHLWLETDTMIFWMWYDDGNSSQWIQVSGGSSSTEGGPVGDFVEVAGDTMTGNLNIQANFPVLTINDMGTTNGAVIRGARQNNTRWQVLLGYDPATGDNFSINSFDDAGAYRGQPLSINRQTGAVNLAGRLNVADGAVITGVGGNTCLGTYAGVGHCAEFYSAGTATYIQSINRPAQTFAPLNVFASYGEFNIPSADWFGFSFIMRGSGHAAGAEIGVENTSGPSFLTVNSVNDPCVRWANATVQLALIQHNMASWNFYSEGSRTNGVYLMPGGSSWIAASDARLPYKVSAAPVSDTLSKLEHVQLYRNVVPIIEKEELFFKAQELALAFPELVHEPTGPQSRAADYVPTGVGDLNIWGIGYDRIGAVALQAVKELLEVVKKQAEEIAALKVVIGTRK